MPAPAAGVRVRRRGPDRDRGDRDRRARRSSRPKRRTRPRPCGDGRAPRHAVHRDHVPGRELRRSPAWRSPSSRRSSPRSRRHVYGDGDPVLPVPGVHRAAPVPGREHAFARSRASPRSWPRTASCLASSRSAATGWPISYGIIALGLDRGDPGRDVFRRRDPPPDPAVRRRRVHRLHDQPGGHDPALARANGRTGWRRRLAINAIGCGAHRGRRCRRDRRRRRRRRCSSSMLIPMLVIDDAVHPPPVRGPGAGALRPRRHRVHRAASRAAGRRPGQRDQPGGRPGRELRADPGHRRAGRLRHRGHRGGRGPPRALGAPDAGRAAGHRRIAVPGDHRAVRRLPRRPRRRRGRRTGRSR